MGYLRYDYSLAKASVRHGLAYENSATTRPINSWNWFYGTYRLYGEFEVYSRIIPFGLKATSQFVVILNIMTEVILI